MHLQIITIIIVLLVVVIITIIIVVIVVLVVPFVDAGILIYTCVCVYKRSLIEGLNTGDHVYGGNRNTKNTSIYTSVCVYVCV